MTSLFLKLFNMSIAASWLILAVIVLRVVLKRAPKWVHCILWALVGIRLLCPISIESAWSLIPSSEPLPPEVVQFDPYPAIHSGITIIDNTLNPVIGEAFAASPAGSVNPLYVWISLAGIVWLTGVIALVIYTVISYLRLCRVVCEAVRQRDHLYLCDHIQTPFILGVVRPRIYLPSDINEVQMQSVIAHEQAHLSRHDHWWKPLGWAILTVYWFNPFCWIAYILLCRDIELACDEKVICSMDMEARKAYSMALLSCSIPRRLISACPLAFGEMGVRERIEGVLHYKKPALWVVAVAVIACAAAAMCFLTNPKEVPDGIELADPDGDGYAQVPRTEQSQTSATAEDLFASMPGIFHFLSGAGGWQTELYWNGDGTFSGIYEDADMGAQTIYRCVFTGSMSTPEKIGALEYSARIAGLNYEKPDMITFEQGFSVITAAPYGLDGADEIRIYLPGYPVSELPQETLTWLRGGAEEFRDGQEPETLPFYVLYNVRGQQAFFSAIWSAFSGASSSRSEHTDLTFIAEGLEESIPAYLFRDPEYSLYIPHDGWQYHQMPEHDLPAKCWISTINPDVSLTVRHLGDRNLVEAREWEREQNTGFQLLEDKQGGIGGTDSTGKSMLEVFFYSGQNAIYAVELRYPVEAIEGFGTRLHVIQDTFQVSNSGQGE